MSLTLHSKRWIESKLSEVARIDRVTVDPKRIQSGTTYVGLENIDGEGQFYEVRSVESGEIASSKFAFNQNHLLYGKLRPYLKKIARPHFSGVCSTDILPILAGDRIDRNFLYYCLRQPHYIELATARSTGANLPRLSPKELAEFTIPLPPLEEQRRIAAILDKADEVRRKRQQAIALTEELLRSLFLDMFGDPVTNPKGWEVVPMKDVVSETQYGTATKSNSEGIGIPVLRMNNITYGGEIYLDDIKWCQIPTKDESKLIVQRGDLLFNRTNSPELVGKTAVWRSNEKYAYAGYLIRVRFKTDKILSEYVSAYLNSNYGKKYLFEKAKPSINMSNFSASEFLKIPLPLASLNLQTHFVKVSDALRSSVSRQKNILEDVNNLFNSLLQKAFRGEL